MLDIGSKVRKRLKSEVLKKVLGRLSLYYELLNY